MRRSTLPAATLVALLVTGCPPAPLLPDPLGGLRAGEPARAFDRQGLYQLIDGAAEVYLMHGFQRLWTRTYQGRSTPLLVELFDQGSPAGAYAAFTHNRALEGEAPAVGEEAHLLAGSLWFFRGKYLVCVSGRGERTARPAELLELGRAVAARLPRQGGKPELARRLPAHGLRPRTIRYFRAAAALGYHVEELDGRGLGLDGRAEAVLAEYDPGLEGPSLLLLIRYPDEQAARAGLEAVKRQIGEPRVTSEARGWAGAERAGRLVGVVLQARGPAAGRALLKAATSREGSP